MTRLEVMFEQQAVPAMQGDSKGVRGLRTLVCVVKEITVQDPQGDKGMTPVHNVKELDSLLEEYGQMYAEARDQARKLDASSDEDDDE